MHIIEPGTFFWFNNKEYHSAYNNGNIDNSKMIKIEDQFAMIIEFSTSNKRIDIESKLNAIQDLKIYSKLVKDYDLLKKSTKTY